MLQLVTFLGNPGNEYERTRHNVGWMLAEAMPFFPTLDWQKKHKGLHASISNARIPPPTETAVNVPAAISEAMPLALPEKLHFIKPQTYMNLSGESVQAAASFYKIKLDEIIVVHDDIELPFGTISLKYSGGLGGHNGLRSIKECFGSPDFWRLRIGIGRPDDRVPGRGGNPEFNKESGIADWVLSDFTAHEVNALVPVLDTGASLLVRVLAAEPDGLVPKWAKKNCLAEDAPLS